MEIVRQAKSLGEIVRIYLSDQEIPIWQKEILSCFIIKSLERSGIGMARAFSKRGASRLKQEHIKLLKELDTGATCSSRYKDRIFLITWLENALE